MRCDHCKYEFDTVALKANQGTQVVCPSCGKATTVRYSLKDSLKDFHGFLVRDPKYVSRPMYLLACIVFGIFTVAMIVFFIRAH